MAFYDASGGVSVTDVNGTVTQIAKGVLGDAGGAPRIVGVGGTYVAVMTDYTTAASSLSGVVGTLSIWTHSLGQLTQVATGSTGIFALAPDSSFFVYTHAVDSTGSDGSIAVAPSTGVGGTDLVTGARVALSNACEPYAVFDEQLLVLSACAGGSSSPQVSSFDSTNAWSATVLQASAGPNDTYGVYDLTADQVGKNALIDTGGESLVIQSLSGSPSVPVGMLSKYANGYVPFYLSTDSTFALFTDSAGYIDKATFATPSALTAPTITTFGGQDAGSGLFLILAVSPDNNCELDYNSAVFDSTTRAPLSMNLRNLETSVTTSLVPGDDTATFPASYAGTTPFTADSSYALYGTALEAVKDAAGTFVMDVGKLEAVSCATGQIHELVSDPVVPYAFPTGLTGTQIIYSQNYLAAATTQGINGAGTADLYTADAAVAAPGKRLVVGADVAFYLTADRSHVFYTLSQVGTGGAALPGDGLYSVAVP